VALRLSVEGFGSTLGRRFLEKALNSGLDIGYGACADAGHFRRRFRRPLWRHK
jgi:hypothetical protein